MGTGNEGKTQEVGRWEEIVIQDFQSKGKPLIISKGETQNTGLTFNLGPGAIVAHPGSVVVVVVCGGKEDSSLPDRAG
jgi:hypothetical protein